MRRNLNRVRDYFEGTIPLYFPDEFKGHFRMTRETCELLTRAVMPTGRIPLGNESGRAAIPCIFALLTKVCRGSGAKVVQKNIQVICRIITSGTLILSRRIGSHVEFDFRALRNWARALRNGRMERNFPVIPIFRNFRPTSRGTPKISEWNSGKCLFHSLPNPEFPEFLVEWKAPQVSLHSIVSRPLSFNKLSVPKPEVRGLKIRKR